MSNNAKRPQVMIVGGGFAGLHAARTLGRAEVEVTLIDRHNHHLFQPLLYQVATAGLTPAEIAYPIRAILRHQMNTRVLLGEVTAVDVAARELVLGSDRIKYDYLILATGAQDSYFGHRQWEQNAPGLKSLEDALEIRRRILLAFELAERTDDETRRRALLTFAIIGAGPTGVELAGAISEIARHVLVSDFRRIDPKHTRIILIEGGPRVLPTFPDALSDKAAAALGKLEVEVLTGKPVTAIGPNWVTLGSARIEAATILWAAGVVASPLMKTLGAETTHGDRLIVAPDLTVPGHPEIFVVGDSAALMRQNGKPVPGVAPAAIQEGRHAAKNIMQALRGKPYEAFRYFDKGNLASIGRSAAVADFGWLKVSGFTAWLLWLVVHILYLIGFRNRMVVMFDWAWAYFSYHRGARVIIGNIHRDASDSPVVATQSEA